MQFQAKYWRTKNSVRISDKRFLVSKSKNFELVFVREMNCMKNLVWRHSIRSRFQKLGTHSSSRKKDVPSLISCYQKRRKMDYYAVLEVEKDCTNDEILDAYRRLALKWHPDSLRHPDIIHDNEEEAATKFRQISEAYQVLSDGERRKNYDESVSMAKKEEESAPASNDKSQETAPKDDEAQAATATSNDEPEETAASDDESEEAPSDDESEEAAFDDEFEETASNNEPPQTTTPKDESEPIPSMDNAATEGASSPSNVTPEPSSFAFLPPEQIFQQVFGPVPIPEVAEDDSNSNRGSGSRVQGFFNIAGQVGALFGSLNFGNLGTSGLGKRKHDGCAGDGSGNDGTSIATRIENGKKIVTITVRGEDAETITVFENGVLTSTTETRYGILAKFLQK